MVILSNQQYEKIVYALATYEKYVEDDDIIKSYKLKPEVYINDEQIEYKDIAQIIEKIMERRN